VIPRALTALLLLFPFTATCQTQDQIRLDKKAAREDIATFETAMRERWSYFRADGVDPTAALQALSRQASNGISVQDLGLGILKIIALFRDGHADVSNLEYPQGFLPFDEDVVAGQIVALNADRVSLLDKDHPYLSELGDRRLNPSAYAYDKPVVILTDFRDFSGTDLFVSAFKGRRNVTLIGTPTAGASAFKRGLSLPNSHLVVHLASMISYKRDGKLHDGNGTQPDIHIERTPESLLRFGEDNQLRKAIEVLGRH